MLEAQYYKQGYRHIFGIDEAGRGPMAGPLVAAAVCLPLVNIPQLKEDLKGVKDSKRMTRLQRERAADKIKEIAIAWGIAEVTANEMPSVGNMTLVTLEAMRRALMNALSKTKQSKQPDVLLVDYYQLPGYEQIPQEHPPKGERQSLSIAAASVLAKVYRDAKMIEYGKLYPEYGFEKHKGYATPAHLALLLKRGATPIHRLNYAPVKQAIEQGGFWE